MAASRRFHFSLKYRLLLLLLLYIIMCQSCMTMRMTPNATAAYFKNQKTNFISKSITVANHRIHYIETGNPQNPTLFFVHGSPGSWDAFKQYLTDSLLLRKYRMIAIDRPGFGYSEFGHAENLAMQARIFEEMLSKIDNRQPVTLIGHSLGGPIIVKMATERPAIYKNLVIVAGSVDPGAETPELWRMIIKANPLRYLIPGAMRPANDELWWLKRDLIEMKPDLRKIASDVIIIHGTKDKLVPYSNAAFIKRELVHAKTIETIAIENANHFIPWTHFKLIRDVLYGLK